jgi:hypothetical protein
MKGEMIMPLYLDIHHHVEGLTRNAIAGVHGVAADEVIEVQELKVWNLFNFYSLMVK